MRIALATSPGAELISQDDRLLAAAIHEHGGSAEIHVWSDTLVDWGAYDVVAVRTTWDYHLQLDTFLSWVDQVAASTRLFNPSELIHWNAHKSYLLELEKAGVPTVPTFVLGSLADLDSARSVVGTNRIVIKPEVGASALNTFVVDRNDLQALRMALAQVLAPGLALLQPYFKKVETEGEVSLVWIDGRVTHAIQKRPKPGDFRVQIDHGGSNERVEPTQEGIDLATRCIAALPARPCFARVDGVRDSEGRLRLMELELIEPELMFEWAPETAAILAKDLLIPPLSRERGLGG